MRKEIGEPMGMRVRSGTEAEVTLDFAAFVTAIEREEIRPEDEVCSHIVTQDRWVQVGQMRLYQEIREEKAREKAARVGVWPPAPQF